MYSNTWAESKPSLTTAVSAPPRRIPYTVSEPLSTVAGIATEVTLIALVNF